MADTQSPLTKLSLLLTAPRITKENEAEYLFVYMLPPGSEDDVLDEATRMVNTGLTKHICFIHTGAGSGALGFDYWKQQLVDRGVPDTAIVGVPYIYPEGHINTLFEAESFAKFIKDKSLRNVSVLCQPFHLLRSVITLVSALKRREVVTKVNPFSAPVTSWTDHIVHSQGKLSGKRFELIDSEDVRIDLYQRKGDLLLASEVLDYLGY